MPSKLTLLLPLIRREIFARYRGSALGILWSLLTPLFMLAVYTLVFGGVFQAKWANASSNASMAEFAVILFAGLIVFQLFAEVINGAPGLIISNKNYVKKIVFPLELLVPVSIGAALFQACVSFIVLMVFVLIIYGTIPWTAIFLPMALIPFCLLLSGLGWFLASLGTFVRDINQFLGTIVTAMLFLSPIFFPVSALPDWIRPFAFLNPIAFPVTQIRKFLIFGEFPDYMGLIIYAFIAAIIAVLGYFWFQKTRKGFADVL